MKFLFALAIVIIVAFLLIERRRKRNGRRLDLAPEVISLETLQVSPNEYPVQIVDESQVEIKSKQITFSQSGLVASGVVSDVEGNVYVCGRSPDGLFINKSVRASKSKYELIWSHSDDTSKGANCICLFEQHIYVACDSKIVKLTCSDGEQIVSNEFDNCLIGRMAASNGSLYLVGKLKMNGVLMKLSADNLTLDWIKVQSEVGCDMSCVVSDNRIYTTGWQKVNEMTLRCYDLGGEMIWEKLSENQIGVDIALDENKLMITGFSLKGNKTSTFVNRYDSNGDLIYTTGLPIETLMPTWCIPSALMIDLDGNSIITGYSKNKKGVQEAFGSKFSRVGQHLWTRHFKADGGYSYGIALTNESGDPLLIGNSSGSINGEQIPTQGVNSYYMLNL